MPALQYNRHLEAFVVVRPFFIQHQILRRLAVLALGILLKQRFIVALMLVLHRLDDTRAKVF